MFDSFLGWLFGLFGGSTEPKTIGNHNTIPETSNPQHEHLSIQVQHQNTPNY